MRRFCFCPSSQPFYQQTISTRTATAADDDDDRLAFPFVEQGGGEYFAKFCESIIERRRRRRKIGSFTIHVAKDIRMMIVHLIFVS